MKKWDCHGTNTPRCIGIYMGCTHTHIHPKELLLSWNTKASHFTFKIKNYSPERERERERRETFQISMKSSITNLTFNWTWFTF